MPAAERTCKERGCFYAAAPRSPRCGWHRLAKMTPAEQADAASRRLARAQATPEFAHRSRVARADLPPGTLWCSGCQSVVPTFYSSGTRCKACARAARRAAHVQKVYGLSPAEEAALLELQGGRCAICRNHQRSQALAVDHDHVTGYVRGLCCVRCNHDLLGAAHDDVELLRSAVYYLENPPASGRWVAADCPVERRSTQGDSEAPF